MVYSWNPKQCLNDIIPFLTSTNSVELTITQLMNDLRIEINNWDVAFELKPFTDFNTSNKRLTAALFIVIK